VTTRHCGDETEHAGHEWELVARTTTRTPPRHGRPVESETTLRFYCIGTTAEGAAIARRRRFSRGFVDLRPPVIEWGSTMCRRCVALATVALDGEPFCIAHADDELERACVPAELAAMLPGLDE
jgi:hypothetical protein